MNMLNPAWMAQDPQLRSNVHALLIEAMFSPEASVPISAVAREMGIFLENEQLLKVGSTVANFYRSRYGCEPPKRNNPWGDERQVNAYTDADRDLIVSAIRQVMGKAENFGSG